VRVYLGLHDFGKNYGIAFAGYGLGAVVGPVAAGRYVDATGDYSLLLVMAAGSLVVACALLLTLGRYTRPARTDDQGPVDPGSPLARHEVRRTSTAAGGATTDRTHDAFRGGARTAAR
jgi:MFS family permease